MPRTLRRLLPSPAMVVALIALVMSLGGSAYALVITGASIRNNTVTGKDIRKHSLRGHDLRANSVGGGGIKESSLGPVPAAFAAGTATGLDNYALLNSDGVLIRGKGLGAGDPASKIDTGIYQVIFNRDVTPCVYVASVGAIAAGGPAQGVATVASMPGNVNGVRVRTENNDDTIADKPFHLIVSC